MSRNDPSWYVCSKTYRIPQACQVGPHMVDKVQPCLVGIPIGDPLLFIFAGTLTDQEIAQRLLDI